MRAVRLQAHVEQLQAELLEGQELAGEAKARAACCQEEAERLRLQLLHAQAQAEEAHSATHSLEQLVQVCGGGRGGVTLSY